MLVEVEPSRVVARLRLLVLFVLALSLAGWAVRHGLGHWHAMGMVPLVDVNAEGNVPTWFSTLLLALAAGLSGVASRAPGLVLRRLRAGWAGVAALLAFLSLDEAVGFHERVSVALGAVFGPIEGPLRFVWVVPGAAFVLALGVLSIRFLRDLDAGVRRRLLVAAATYFGAAVGLEMVGGWWVSAWGEDGALYGLLTHVEEGAEMLGAVGFCGAALSMLALLRSGLAVVEQPVAPKVAREPVPLQDIA